MDFQNPEEEAKKLGLGGDYMKLADGENKLRVLCLPETVASHFLGAGQKPATCTMNDDCPFCKKGVKKSVKVLMYVLDREDETIKLGDFPWSIFTGLGDLAKNSEYAYKDLPPYDIMITKTGTGMETRYRVDACKNEDPLTEEQAEVFKNKKPIIQIVADRIEKAQSNMVNDFDNFLKEDTK